MLSDVGGEYPLLVKILPRSETGVRFTEEFVTRCRKLWDTPDAHGRSSQPEATLLERLKRLLVEDPTLAAQLAAITGDGNVVGDHNVATVNKLSAGDYAIQIGQLQLTLSPEQLRSLPVSAYTKSPLPVASTELPWEPEMIFIAAGEFLMGSDPGRDKDAFDNEQAQHTLYLPDYYLAKMPVTNAQYAAFVDATDYDLPEHWTRGKPPWGKEDHPVVHVSWYDAVTYCNWLSQATGKAYRLPSEAEWEKGARGADGRIYPWGNEPPDEERCNFGDNIGRTTTVGRYSPQGNSPYGCTDMAGNVFEWTRSLCGRNWEKLDFKYPYDSKDGREDLEAGGIRVLRGGAFSIGGRGVRCACRGQGEPDVRDWDLGFRVVAARAPG